MLFQKLTLPKSERQADKLSKKIAKLESQRDDLKSERSQAIVAEDDVKSGKLRDEIMVLDADLAAYREAAARLDEEIAAKRQSEADKKAAKERQKALAELSSVRDSIKAADAEIDEHVKELNGLVQTRACKVGEAKLLQRQTGVQLPPDLTLNPVQLGFRLRSAVWLLAPALANALDLKRISPTHWRTMSTAGDEKRAA